MARIREGTIEIPECALDILSMALRKGNREPSWFRVYKRVALNSVRFVDIEMSRGNKIDRWLELNGIPIMKRYNVLFYSESVKDIGEALFNGSTGNAAASIRKLCDLGLLRLVCAGEKGHPAVYMLCAEGVANG